ncbi:MAG: RNA pseudouridine synthase [Treponema sp.]|nr:RNA pseudouridine synthase [Treponema sp.]
MSGVTIIHEPTAAEPFVVLSKPAGLASAPLVAGGESALTECARLFPAVLKVSGKKTVEGGLLHRIDTATSGLLLIATSQDFYDHIIAAQERGGFVKGYRADCDLDADNAAALGGFPDAADALQDQNTSARGSFCGLEISSYFRPFGKGSKEVRPVLPSSNAAALKKLGSKKLYSTKVVAADFCDGDVGAKIARVECKIAQGYRHQVRCHLAWLGLPVRGDLIYNRACRTDNAQGQEAAGGQGQMRFCAASLEFPDLFGDKVFRFALD